MSQYYNLTKFLAAAMFKKPSPIIPDGAFPENSEPGIILRRLRQMIQMRNINTAEDLLFNCFNKDKPVFIAIALDFYAHLSELSEDELRECNFSAEEIGEGLRDMMSFYKIKIKLTPTPPPTQKSGEAPVAPNVLADPPKTEGSN